MARAAMTERTDSPQPGMARHPLSVLQVITPSRFSGAERVVTYLAEALQARGHRVLALCKRNELLLEEMARRGVECRAVPIAGKANLRAPRVILGEARRFGADVIHTHLSTASLWGGVAAKLAKIPVISHVQALNSRTCFRFSDRLVAVSEGVKEHLVAQRVPAGRIDVVHNAVDLAAFEGLDDPWAVRREFGLRPEDLLVGVVAHLTPRKGHRYLVEAAALLLPRWPNVWLVFVGEGPLRGELEGQAAGLGISHRLIMAGYRQDALRLVNAMDVVVLPSVDKEGLPLCLVEAAILAKPTVATDIPGAREVIAEGATGMLVPPRDPRALAIAIDTLLGDPQLRRRMGEAGQARARRWFAKEGMAERTEAIYYRLLGLDF